MLGLGLGINKGGFVTNLFRDAALAFSLRDLGLGATYVVRVRRDTDNAEQDFIASEVTNGTLEFFVGGGNGYVTIWYNQIGGNDAIQNTASQQPKIVDTGNLVMKNGKPSLDFDGVDDELTVNANLTQPFTAFSLGSTTTNSSTIFDGNNPRSFMRFTTLNKIDIYSGSIISNINENNEYKLGYGLYNGTNSEVFYNQNSITVGNPGTSGLGELQIGAGTAFSTYTGLIQEIVLFDSNQSQNKDLIQKNINNYYGIY